MDLYLALSHHECILTVTGDVAAADVHELQRRIVEVLDVHARDVVIDMRRVPSVDDGIYPALVLARSRAKAARCRLVVADRVDGQDGVTARGLRSRGMQMRIPIYGDVDEAVASLAAIRAARAKLTVPFAGEHPAAAAAVAPAPGASS